MRAVLSDPRVRALMGGGARVEPFEVVWPDLDASFSDVYRHLTGARGAVAVRRRPPFPAQVGGL